MEIRAVFVDAAGTLLHPREPVGVTYARTARLHGHEVDPVVVERQFRAAMRSRRGAAQAGDGRVFWEGVVREAVGTDDPRVYEDLYRWYTTPRAWWLDVEALTALGKIARMGIVLGIISNWDTRLRTLYTRFALDRMFPVLICSAEHEVEKPDPAIFRIACEVAGVRPREAVHIGDDQEYDVDGAARAGLIGIRHDEDDGWRDLPERILRLRRLPFR